MSDGAGRAWGRRVLVAGALLLMPLAVCLAVSLIHPVERVRTTSLLRLEGGQLLVATASYPMNTGFFGAVVDGAKGGALKPSWWRPRSTEAWAASRAGPRVTLRITAVPLGMVIGVWATIVGAVWLLLRRSMPAGHCAACGYDVRGLPAGRCPECGVVARLIRWLLTRRRAVGLAARG